MKNNRNRKMIIVLTILIGLLLLVAIYLTYFQVVKAPFYSNHDLNARNWVDESKVLRGSILDRNGNSLAYSKRDQKGNNYRIYNYNYMYTPIIGYNSSSLGRSGIESSYNRTLLNIPDNDDFISQVENMYRQSDRGKDVYLSIDTDIQAYMNELLGDYRGAIVVLDPRNGDILSMVSKPTFNVNQIHENWDKLIDAEDGRLINRATQGLYPPGSIFKLVTATALLEKNIDLDYVDQGKTTIDGYTIHNINNNEYGEIDLTAALVNSSNAYFADKSTQLNAKDFLDVTNRYMIGVKYDFDIPKNIARLPYKKKMSQLEIAATAFGQGDTLITPLDMAAMVSSIGNKGVLMKPRLVTKVVDKKFEQDIKPIVLSNAISQDISESLTKAMTKTSAKNVKISSGLAVAGKSGTAEVENATHLWYVGFGPSDNAKYAIAIIVENTGLENGHVATSLFERAMNYLLTN